MKKISVSFTCEINLKDESNIDVDCVRDTKMRLRQGYLG